MRFDLQPRFAFRSNLIRHVVELCQQGLRNIGDLPQSLQPFVSVTTLLPLASNLPGDLLNILTADKRGLLLLELVDFVLNLSLLGTQTNPPLIVVGSEFDITLELHLLFNQLVDLAAATSSDNSFLRFGQLASHVHQRNTIGSHRQSIKLLARFGPTECSQMLHLGQTDRKHIVINRIVYSCEQI